MEEYCQYKNYTVDPEHNILYCQWKGNCQFLNSFMRRLSKFPQYFEDSLPTSKPLTQQTARTPLALNDLKARYKRPDKVDEWFSSCFSNGSVQQILLVPSTNLLSVKVEFIARLQMGNDSILFRRVVLHNAALAIRRRLSTKLMTQGHWNTAGGWCMLFVCRWMLCFVWKFIYNVWLWCKSVEIEANTTSFYVFSIERVNFKKITQVHGIFNLNYVMMSIKVNENKFLETLTSCLFQTLKTNQSERISGIFFLLTFSFMLEFTSKFTRRAGSKISLNYTKILC